MLTVVYERGGNANGFSSFLKGSRTQFKTYNTPETNHGCGIHLSSYGFTYKWKNNLMLEYVEKSKETSGGSEKVTYGLNRIT